MSHEISADSSPSMPSEVYAVRSQGMKAWNKYVSKLTNEEKLNLQYDSSKMLRPDQQLAQAEGYDILSLMFGRGAGKDEAGKRAVVDWIADGRRVAVIQPSGELCRSVAKSVVVMFPPRFGKLVVGTAISGSVGNMPFIEVRDKLRGKTRSRQVLFMTPHQALNNKDWDLNRSPIWMNEPGMYEEEHIRRLADIVETRGSTQGVLPTVLVTGTPVWSEQLMRLVGMGYHRIVPSYANPHLGKIFLSQLKDMEGTAMGAQEINGRFVCKEAA